MVRGRATWDHSLLPVDEFQRRLSSLQKRMLQESLDAMIVFGGGNGDLAYLTNFEPSLRWAVGIVPSSGEPLILMGNWTGDLSFQKTLTWVKEIKGFEKNIGAQIRQALQELGITPRRIGHVGGMNCIPASSFEGISHAFEDISLIDSTHILRKMRLLKSPREQEIIRRGYKIARNSMELLRQSKEEGENNFEAVGAAEKSALDGGAQDVRVLLSADNSGYLYPMMKEDQKRKQVLAYVAVQFLGYWAESFSCNYDSEELAGVANRVLKTLEDSAKEGITCSDLANLAARECRHANLLPMMDNSFGNGVGLSVEEEPFVKNGSNSMLEKGSVLSLRVGLRENSGYALVSDIVAVGRDESDRII